MIAILGVDTWISLWGRLFHSLVSLALYGCQGTVVAVSHPVQRSSEPLPVVAHGESQEERVSRGLTLKD